MAFHCLRCKAEIDKTYKACPHCGEPMTDFLRRYAEEPVDGKYQIVERLGAGGMGEVYKVQHVMLGATRVIKVIRPQISESKDAHERFLREARAATKIQHPNVGTLHDFSALPDGSHFMVWEFIDGENVAQRIRARGVLQPRYAVRIMIQALRGLEAVHRAGIVHRDISPENIMITREQHGEETVKIIDLGVAKVDDSSDNATRVGVFVGKLRYASPEHLGFLAEGERIDGRADLYSLAMVLYEMLTGRPPFEATSPHEYILLHSRPTAFRPLDLPPDLPGGAELQAVMVRALDHDRNNRYANAREFMIALERVERTLPDPVTTETMNIQVSDTDKTWMPTPLPDTLHRSTVKSQVVDSSAAPTIQTPLPGQTGQRATAAKTLNTAAPTVRTDFTPPPPAVAPPQQAPIVPKARHGGVIAILVILAIFVVAGAGVAYFVYRRFTAISKPLIAATSTTTPQQTASTAPPTASVDVVTTTPMTITEAETSATTDSTEPTGSNLSTTTATQAQIIPPVTTPRQNTTPPVVREPRQTAVVQPREDPADEPRVVPPPPPPASNIRSFIDGDTGDAEVNEQIISNLHRQLNGVNRVVIRGRGEMHEQLIERFKNALPSVAVVDNADTVIDFEGTMERVNRGKSRRQARATITKNGRVIFRYELPPEEIRVGDSPAEAFSRVLSEAFGH
ncbi:MAG: protein kinase [Thermoanaerobaculia bacterium]|nr:protein kinase [Thermoanaerobaculia bacterium]